MRGANGRMTGMRSDDDRHLPNRTMADYLKRVVRSRNLAMKTRSDWLRTTLQVNARKKRIDTMEHGPKRTALKKQQRLEIDLLNREILITHGRPFYNWTTSKGILHYGVVLWRSAKERGDHENAERT